MALPLPEGTKSLERLTTFTTLGIRFWDPVRDEAIEDDLRVTARAETAVAPVVPAFRTRSGVFAFEGLPGLHRVEHPDAGPAPMASPPAARSFVVEVEDRQDRFVPVTFRVGLPLPYRGVYPKAESGSPPGFYLFSASTRAASPGLATLRTQLVDLSLPGLGGQEPPAAHAVVEVRVPGPRTWFGVADERGALAVLFPYPTLVSSLASSPPEAPRIPLHEQTWRLEVRVRYAPTALDYPHGSARPDLRSLFGQGPALLWPSTDGPPALALTAELSYDRELILQTDRRSVLRISTSGPP